MRLTEKLSEEAKRKWPIWNRMVTWSMTSRDSEKSRHVPKALSAQYLENSWKCYLATIGDYYKIVCSETVRTVGYPSDSLASCF